MHDPHFENTMEKATTMNILPSLMFGVVLGATCPADARERIRINFDWRFAHNEQSGPEQVSYDDSAWQTVHLPHDASIYGPFVKDELNGARNNGFRPRRIGWYRKRLSIPQDLMGKRVYLHFEGIFVAAHIWVNGQKVGRHANGYLDSYWDVTNLVRTGDNLIAVRYDNRNRNTSRWYSGEGIYRNVWLTVMDGLHVQFWGGVYITTPQITARRALVAVRTRVKNDTDAEQKVTGRVQPPRMNSRVEFTFGDTGKRAHSHWRPAAEPGNTIVKGNPGP